MAGATDGQLPLASVIVPCRNQLVALQACTKALLRYTRPPWELIVVDGGSSDGTRTYLSGLVIAAPLRVEVLNCPEVRGDLAEAYRRGLEAARGDFLAFLTARTVVTEGWLAQLIALTNLDPAASLAGPMCNLAHPPQQVDSPSYRNLD
jgi:glycosyltransferase involved in cell wall biosynthesis